MAKRDVDHDIDSGELWISTATAPAQTERPDRPDRQPLPLAITPARRPVVRVMLALLSSRERVWMSSRLRALSPAARVKFVYELERLSAQLAQL